MRLFKDVLNLATSATGLMLVAKLMFTYDNPIGTGALFVLLLCAKCCVEVIWE